MIATRFFSHRADLDHHVDLRGHRVILIELAQFAIAEQEKGRVADGNPKKVVPADDCCKQRRSHAVGFRRFFDVLRDAAICGRGHSMQQAGNIRDGFFQQHLVHLDAAENLGHDQCAGDIAGKMPAHAIGKNGKSGFLSERETGRQTVLLEVPAAF